MSTPNSHDEELVKGFTALISSVNPEKKSEEILASVRGKIAQIHGQEGHFLRAVLDSDVLSPGDKVANFVGVHDDRTPGERYPKEYHRRLVDMTNELNVAAAY